MNLFAKVSRHVGAIRDFEVVEKGLPVNESSVAVRASEETRHAEKRKEARNCGRVVSQ